MLFIKIIIVTIIVALIWKYREGVKNVVALALFLTLSITFVFSFYLHRLFHTWYMRRESKD